ncbi:hypothetical protein RIR_jg34996.t1 [Rhizophagus irregularis DAOM 181602=DAOM 197198]|nr:hypothetical protein RIR_jg34996.t1 [Rhizophagus irregularis DAOM 181602=DAOM 197198]
MLQWCFSTGLPGRDILWSDCIELDGFLDFFGRASFFGFLAPDLGRTRRKLSKGKEVLLILLTKRSLTFHLFSFVNFGKFNAWVWAMEFKLMGISERCSAGSSDVCDALLALRVSLDNFGRESDSNFEEVECPGVPF